MKIILISQCVDVIDMCYFESGSLLTNTKNIGIKQRLIKTKLICDFIFKSN